MTETIYLTGTSFWAKVFDHNLDRDENYAPEGGQATIDILMDQENVDKLSASGSRLKPKIESDGIRVRFKRKFIHPSIEALGGLPQVVDKEGVEWDPEISIGNGSKVEVAISVYDTPMGKGTRLEGVKVIDLEEYTPEEKKLPF